MEKAETDDAVEKSILKELKLDGLINAGDQVVEHLEHDLSGASVLFPMGRNKDGTLSRTSRVLEPEAFETVLAYTEKKEQELKEAMYAGEVKAAPYELGGASACDYCACRDICGFDQRIQGDEYRRLEKYTLEEAVAKMKERLDSGKDSGGDQKALSGTTAGLNARSGKERGGKESGAENHRKGGAGDGREMD